jgi:hypothetical protein
MLHSNSFSPETSRISPVSAKPKHREGFRIFFVKHEVSVSQNYVKILARSFGCWFRIKSVKKLILISDHLIETWYFVLLFWPVWGLNPELFGLKVNNEEWTKRPTDLNEKMQNLGDV